MKILTDGNKLTYGMNWEHSVEHSVVAFSSVCLSAALALVVDCPVNPQISPVTI